jgi:signal transduction histidine kinase
MEAKDQFLSLVSHELRTPTAIIVGNGEILLRRADEVTETDRRQALEDILSQATRLHGTIENLLLLTRLERDSDLNREPVHLERVLQSAMATQLQRSPQAKIVYRSLGSTTAPPFVLGEPTLITLVADNLIGNAIKYSDPETPIEVTLDAEDPGQIEVHVLDRGIGVSKNECEWIFTPFYRSRAAVARASGMGIGLAVCRRIVEAQGGWIKASPRQGGGSDFAFALPTLTEGQGQDGDSTPSTG